MSAIIGILHRDSAHLLVDGAAYLADGTLISPAVKAWPMPHLNAVITVRGAGLAGPIVSAMFSQFHSFDEAMAMAPEVIRGAIDDFGQVLDMSSVGAVVQVVAVGLGEQGPAGFFVSSRDEQGISAGVVASLGPLAFMPATADIQHEVQARFAGREPADLDPATDGLALMEILRRHPDAPPGGHAPVHIVGVHAQLTSVTSQGISTRILRRWPDRIGERINPVAA